MKGVIHTKWSKGRKGKMDLSEAPSAYKNIDTVMKNQEDLVAIVTELRPIACAKG